MKPLFNQVKLKAPKKSAFDLSHERKLSCDMGELIPILTQEILPGDKFKVNTELLIRMAPMLAPMMHRVNVYTHFFWVPNRLVYGGWQSYITGGADGSETPSFPMLLIDDAHKSQFPVGSLADYMGIPAPQSGTLIDNIYINALPFRAYQLIYNEYYRDQTLTTAVPLTTDNIVLDAEQTALTTLRKRSWEKDYFTSALPWTQRGGVVNLPNTIGYRTNTLVKKSSDGSIETSPGYLGHKATDGHVVDYNNNTNYFLDNINNIDISIINLRRAARLQEWLEKNATGGSRYIEQILAHFKVRVPDFTVQRPVYLGGGKSPVVISEVVSMVKESSNPQGTMTGHGLSAGIHNGFNHFFNEHGYVIGLMSVMPRSAYQQGIPKMYTKTDRYDFAFPEFARIGEQAIQNRELYCDWLDSSANNAATFGYTPRYAEYKFSNSSVHGDFKTTLNFWHMSRIFTSRPALNAAFVECTPTTRPFAVTEGDHLWIQLYNKINAIRPLPAFGTPTL